jgi:hypothetical protein
MLSGFISTHERTKRLLSASLTILAMALTTQSTLADVLFVGSAVNNDDKNRLVVFSSDNPSKTKTMVIRGLQPDERIVCLDVRVADGQLYAVSTKSQLYILDISGKVAQATPIGSPFVPPLFGDSFGCDFNPTNALLRIISDANQNLTINPLNGGVTVNTNLAYVDGNAGTDPGAVCIMYNNNDNDPNTATTLYDIDTTTDVLVTQTPPPSGQLTAVGSLNVSTIGSLIAGCDIVTTGGVNMAYAALQTPEDDRSKLYSVDLGTGATAFIGKIGGPEPLTSLAVLGMM